MPASIRWLIPAIAVAAAALAGCASEPVTLAIRAQPPAVGQKIARPVAFLHSGQMLDETQTVEGRLPLRIGEASDRALRAAYVQGFAQAREVSSLDEFRAMSGPEGPVALLQAEIVGFQAVNASQRPTGPYHAEIIYRFSVFDPAGASAGAWEMHGFASYDPEQARREHSPGFRFDLDGWVAEAPRRAIEDGAVNFVAGLDAVPELMRLRHNLPLAASNIPAERQQPGETVTPGTRQARFPGALTLTVATAAQPKLAAEAGTQEAREADLVPLRITLRNDGAHRLLLDPANLRWQVQSPPAGVPTLSPLPAPVVPMYLARSPASFVALGPMSPGIGMLPGLFAALANAAELKNRERALEAWKARVQDDLLTQGIVAAGAERTGVVYFPKLTVAYGTLQVPVIDLDDAVRYTVRLDLSLAKP